ncbi:MAG: hypothetical protein ACQCN4_13115 [Candidatus Bathyarchaeia archaeon]
MMSKFKMSPVKLAATAFFGVAGILLLALLPLTGFAPHLGFLGIMSLITEYSLFTKRAWGIWLVYFMLIVNTVFGLYTLFAVGLSNILVMLAMLTYAVLTWASTAILILKRKY